MRCPVCAADDDHVVDSRPADDGTAIRRRRECGTCGRRFTTFERIEQPPLVVVKRSGTTTTFSRENVLEGMSRAAKNRVPLEDLRAAAVAVEARLRREGGNEVTSEQVGLAVLGELRDLDPVAYVRFASVYKNFQGPEDFESELSELRKDAPPKP
ncbi:transcriptional regulator NrdR [Salsipaludibacter albus]|uniref:transcriptional regulator NrdR n=1 Tax=Salsipaludibacter albus TaxID=2849650 RepID=UPI001EE45BE2|nr:transcriptional regulator NrdR [Salsipaludibacter albus]